MRSSSSSGRDEGGAFGRFVARGLAALRDELPWAHARMAAALEGRDVLLTVDGEAVPVTARGGAVEVHPLAPQGFSPCVTLATDRATVARLADAERTITDAVVAGEVALRGAVDDLVAFHDGLMAFLAGAVRSPSFPALLDDYRRWVDPGATERTHVR